MQTFQSKKKTDTLSITFYLSKTHSLRTMETQRQSKQVSKLMYVTCHGSEFVVVFFKATRESKYDRKIAVLVTFPP